MLYSGDLSSVKAAECGEVLGPHPEAEACGGYAGADDVPALAGFGRGWLAALSIGQPRWAWHYW